MMRKFILVFLLLFLIVVLAAQTQFDISTFADTTKYGWQDWRDRGDYRADLLDRQKLLQLYEMESNPIRRSIAKSMALPGWGQISSRSYTKGTIILGSELIVLGASLYFFDRSNYYYDKYMNATQIDDIENYYSEAVKPRQYSILLLSLGGIIWIYNIFDVIETTDAYNAMIWQDIVEKYGSQPVNIGPGGVQIRF
jgi:hypothetical protein